MTFRRLIIAVVLVVSTAASAQGQNSVVPAGELIHAVVANELRDRVQQLKAPGDGKTSALEEPPELAVDCAIANGGRAVRPAIASHKSTSPRMFMSRSPSSIRKRVCPYSFSNRSKKER
jgi:hypothetical protein